MAASPAFAGAAVLYTLIVTYWTSGLFGWGSTIQAVVVIPDLRSAAMCQSVASDIESDTRRRSGNSIVPAFRCVEIVADPDHPILPPAKDRGTSL
jgi:hypothetical protein